MYPGTPCTGNLQYIQYCNQYYVYYSTNGKIKINSILSFGGNVSSGRALAMTGGGALAGAAALAKQKAVFLGKISCLSAAIAYVSWRANDSGSAASSWLAWALPEWLAGKQQYFDGEMVPRTRGLLHGMMALVHAWRAAVGRGKCHLFLVLQYASSFALHNVPLSVPRELQVATVDNLCIAGHIAMLAGLGAPKTRLWRGLIAGALAAAVGIGARSVDGTRSWAYKFALMPIFTLGALSWHASGRLYAKGSLRIPFIYLLAFSIFAVHKNGTFHNGNGRLLPAITYDIFHGLQVIATLATLRQVNQL